MTSKSAAVVASTNGRSNPPAILFDIIVIDPDDISLLPADIDQRIRRRAAAGRNSAEVQFRQIFQYTDNVTDMPLAADQSKFKFFFHSITPLIILFVLIRHILYNRE